MVWPHEMRLEAEMVEHKLTVGREEKHRIRIDHSATTGKTAVIIDDATIFITDGRELRAIGHALDSITVTFNIGEKERHKVNIRMRGAFWNHFEVYSDNDMIYRA